MNSEETEDDNQRAKRIVDTVIANSMKIDSENQKTEPNPDTGD